ncbi:MAG: alpha,alpha-trehalose-phosphate synthase (UDP-forming) [Gaiellaceae bacterium]
MAGARRKLIVVSNRGPVSYERGPDGERAPRRGGGGLVTALRSLVSHHDVTWIASAMSDDDRAVIAEAGGGAIEETARDGSPYRLRLVAHDPVAYDWYYNVVSNPTLWFLQHSMWDLTRSPDVDLGLHNAWFGGYVPVNEGFAAAVAAELERDPAQSVFFHDYHLYLAPRLVRERFPDALLTHFVHIPWPSSDYWTVLPAHLRRDVHAGLLANDVVGFHTGRWRRNFMRSCEDVLGAQVGWDEHVLEHAGRRTLVTAHPISVDAAEFDELKESDDVLEQERLIVETRPEHLVLRVDRTDPSKNVVRGFRAFGIFLDLHPELHGRVTLLALLDPSRQDIPEYSEYLGAIQREVRAVNDRFQFEGWVPIQLEIADNFPQSVAAYKQFDVLLVNAVFDGMNLVSKEAPLVNERDGVVVLSENAGAHEEIGEWTLTVNPFDVYGQAQAIHEALQLPLEERRRRIEAIREHVREHDIEGWIEAQLADLDRVPGLVQG